MPEAAYSAGGGHLWQRRITGHRRDRTLLPMPQGAVGPRCGSERRLARRDWPGETAN